MPRIGKIVVHLYAVRGIGDLVCASIVPTGGIVQDARRNLVLAAGVVQAAAGIWRAIISAIE